MNIKKKDKRIMKNDRSTGLISIFALFMILLVPIDVYASDMFPKWVEKMENALFSNEFDEWGKNMKNTSFEVSTFGTQCGPAENEVCISCHELLEEAPDPKIRLLSEPTHGSGVYRLNASEYLSIKMHSYSQYVKPKCIACHFNSNFSKRELRSFKYAKMGDKMCFTCHQDKAPKEFTNKNSFIVADNTPKVNPIMAELKKRFFAQRGSVREYRKRMKLD